MTDPVDFDTLHIGDVASDPPVHVTPNHRVSGESILERPGIFGGKRKTAEKKTPPPDPPPNKPGQFVKPLTEFYNTIALFLMPLDPQLAMVIMGPSGPPTDDDPTPPTVAENCAVAWDNAAQRSPRLRQWLTGFLTVGAFGSLIAAHAPILMVLLSRRLSSQQGAEEFLRRFGPPEHGGQPE